MADCVNSRVEKFTSNGNYLTQWGSQGSGNGQFYGTVGVAVDSSNNVYVTDTFNYRVKKFDSNGNFLMQWGSYGSGSGQFLFPYGVAVDSSNNVYVTDTSNYRVEKFDSNGNYLTKWGSYGSGNGQFNGPAGIAVDGSNNVYVTDSSNYRVEKFTSNGTYLTQWGSGGTGNGQFSSSPVGVAVDSSGNFIYVCDSGNGRIQVFVNNTNIVPPIIISQPTNQTFLATIGGINVTFSVSVVGTAPFAYQWTSNNVAVSAATNAIFTLTNVSLAANGSTYSVLVTNSYGTALSSSAVLAVLPTQAATAVQAWIQRYHGPTNSSDGAYVVAVDSSNNVIVTGAARLTGNPSGYATIKYSSAGVPLWTNYLYGSVLPSAVGAVAVDDSDNVIVTGTSAGDYATIKYSIAGVPLWTNRYNGFTEPVAYGDVARAIAVDRNNNVIVTGTSAIGGGDNDYATIEYSSAGVPLWTNRYNTLWNHSDCEVAALAVDGSNNVIVTGSPLDAAYNSWATTIKYSGAGVPLWTNSYGEVIGGNIFGWAKAIAVDSSNNVIVTVDSESGSDLDYGTIKYSSDGVPLWTNRYNGPGNSDDRAYAVAVDGNNDVVVTGVPATIKYSGAGVPLWTNRYNNGLLQDDSGLKGNTIHALAVDGNNNVIVTGYSTNSTSDYDYATIKYSSAGVPLWTNFYNGPGNGSDKATAVAVDRSGNVIVTGSSWNGTNYDFATIKYICVPLPVMTGLQLTNGSFQLRVDQVLQPGTLVIEASTDLAGWAPVFTNTTPTNVLFYTDPEAGSNLWRFYRAFQFP